MGKAGCSSWLLDTHAWQIVLTATGKKAGAPERGQQKGGWRAKPLASSYVRVFSIAFFL